MIGLGTYAFFWQRSKRAPVPLPLPDMLRRTHDLGVGLFQICDYPPLVRYSDRELMDIRRVKDDLEITLELGTRGVRADDLLPYAAIAKTLGATLLRTMVNSADHHPTMAEAESLLTTVLPVFEDVGVTLALETYEEIATVDLVRLIESVGRPNLGICLDPANMVAALEHPNDVIERCAPYVVNIHAKDFIFKRRDGLVGFALEGAPLGTGLLDFEHLMDVIDPEPRGINRIVEHWLPWQGSFRETTRLEDLWIATNLAYLRREDQTAPTSMSRSASVSPTPM